MKLPTKIKYNSNACYSRVWRLCCGSSGCCRGNFDNRCVRLEVVGVTWWGAIQTGTSSILSTIVMIMNFIGDCYRLPLRLPQPKVHLEVYKYAKRCPLGMTGEYWAQINRGVFGSIFLNFSGIHLYYIPVPLHHSWHKQTYRQNIVFIFQPEVHSPTIRLLTE